MTLKKTKLLLIVLSLVSATLLALVVFGVYDIKTKNKETSSLLNEADQIAKTGETVQFIRMIRGGELEDINTFNNLVFVNDKLVPLIEDIERAGRKLNLDTRILSVERKSSSDSSKPDAIQMVVEAEGSWASTFSFLQAIESLPHRVMIDELNLSKTGTSWRLRIVLLLYSFD